ncbi:hypothetical protein CHS0354_035560 [Potamilus streckersoni]|uniref:TIR domain-containing protein n=1 Tax=Potamilus streckersoni TaxID=2493646 RepID=A0AAE0RSZ4_9BIVA|nr:hypothetical protein CHS0354_035560 [Potamilus streckersoni]
MYLINFTSCSIIFIFTFYPCFCNNCNCTRSKHQLHLSCNPPNEDEIRHCFETNKHVIFVYVTQSGLTRIPPSIRNLTRVQYLDLSHNNITEIDNSTLNSLGDTLQILVMNYNSISILRKHTFDNLISLQEIYLEHNDLHEIEIDVISSKLKNLHYVQFSYNQLEFLDIGLIWVPMLFNYTVNVSGNAISNFTNHKGIRVSDFSYENNSLHVDLQRNNLTTIDVNYLLRLGKVEHIWELYNVGIGGINIAFNRLVCDCRLFPFAFYINIFRFMDVTYPIYTIDCSFPKSVNTSTVLLTRIQDFNCSVEEKCPPQCICTETTALDLMTVVCDNDTLDSLPNVIPEAKHVAFSVHSKNLRELSDRNYFQNVTDLNLSSSSISVIHDDFLHNFESLGTIQIYNNMLETLPEGIQHMNLEKLQSLYLHGNPFKCDCHSKWMKSWLLKYKIKIPDVDKILCESGQAEGKKIIDALDTDFICDSISFTLVLAISFGGVSALIICMFAVYLFREPMQVFLIANYHCFQCLRRRVATNLPFDIFISYSSCDDTYVQDVLIPKLENDGFRLFTQDNFIPGMPITENILKGIDSCFTTLIILSNKFLESDWCRYEFEQAYIKVLQEKERHLIILSLDNELNKDLMPKTLTLYLKMNNYIKVSEKRYMFRLLLALPRIEATERTPLLQERPMRN